MQNEPIVRFSNKNPKLVAAAVKYIPLTPAISGPLGKFTYPKKRLANPMTLSITAQKLFTNIIFPFGSVDLLC